MKRLEAREAAKLEALRQAAQIGIDDIEAGRYTEFASADDAADAIRRMAEEILGPRRP